MKRLPAVGALLLIAAVLVQVDVTYDDGTLQDWADETYGDGVVVLSSMLLDREA
jgi:hypothetical protein